MRILQLASASVPHWVVEQDSILGLSVALRDRGHQIVIGCQTEGPLSLFHKRAEAEGFKDFLPLRFNHRFSPFGDLADIRAIRRALVAREIDVLHAHRGKDHTLAVLAADKKMGGRKVPVVRTKHLLHALNETPLTRWRSVKKTAAIITATAGLADALAEKNKIPRDRLFPIVGGVGRPPRVTRGGAGSFRKLLGIDRHTMLVGLIANLRPEKGVEDFIEAAALLAADYPQVKFAVAGDFGPDKAYVFAMQERLRNAGIADSFLLAGRVEDPFAAMQDLNVGVIASRKSDGAGRVLHEMMAMGVPIVATAVGAIPEVLRDGATGLVVPPGEPAALAAKIEMLFRAPAARIELGRAAREDERTRFSYPVVASKVEQVYFGVLAAAQAAKAPARPPAAPAREFAEEPAAPPPPSAPPTAADGSALDASGDNLQPPSAGDSESARTD